MDDTALNPQVPSQQPPVQNPVVAANTVQTPAPAPQAGSPVMQPQVTGGHPESPGRSGLPTRDAAPVEEAEAVTTASDDQAAVPDAVSDAASIAHETAPDQMIQESHPAVEVSPQLQEAGVEKGPDAEKSNLPEEPLVKTEEAAKQPDTQTAASGISLTSSPLQIKEVQDKNGIRSSLKWFATILLRQLKRMQTGSDKKDSPW